ncbi:MAG: glutaredoxin family protein [Planctomycetaceae bacterium]
MVLLLIGIAGIALVLVGAAARAPWGLARIWLHSPAVLLLGSLLLLLVGAWLTWRGSHPRTAWLPSRAGQRFQSLLLYTRTDCGLCEEASELLGLYQTWLPPVAEVDIDGDPELRRRFDTCVPVVEIDGKLRFRGRVNEVLLRRLIESTPPLNADARYAVAESSGED